MPLVLVLSMVKALQHCLPYSARLFLSIVELSSSWSGAWECFDTNTILYRLLQVEYPAAAIALY
jgi:hypothetical protein